MLLYFFTAVGPSQWRHLLRTLQEAFRNNSHDYNLTPWRAEAIRINTVLTSVGRNLSCLSAYDVDAHFPVPRNTAPAGPALRCPAPWPCRGP